VEELLPRHPLSNLGRIEKDIRGETERKEKATNPTAIHTTPGPAPFPLPKPNHPQDAQNTSQN